MFERMDGILVQATGLTPHVKVHDGYGPTYIVGRELPLLPESASASSGVRIPTDDWPFLYLKPASVPYTYLFVLAAILATATLAVRRAFGGVAVRDLDGREENITFSLPRALRIPTVTVDD